MTGRSSGQPSHEPEAVGFVLAGGQSTRMGTDKAHVELNGEPLVAHGLRIFRDAGLPASIAGGQSALSAYAPVIEDRQTGLGPLSGICAALASTSARWAVFLPIDLPLLPASLIVCLLHHAGITQRPIILSSVNGFPQTFPVILDRATLPTLQSELESGRGGCFSGFQAAAESLGEAMTVLAVETLVQCGQVSHPTSLPATRWFLNVNTPEHLRQAEDLLQIEAHSHSIIA